MCAICYLWNESAKRNVHSVILWLNFVEWSPGDCWFFASTFSNFEFASTSLNMKEILISLKNIQMVLFRSTSFLVFLWAVVESSIPFAVYKVFQKLLLNVVDYYLNMLVILYWVKNFNMKNVENWVQLDIFILPCKRHQSGII